MAGRSDNKVIISILGVDLTKGTFSRVGRSVARFGAIAAGLGTGAAVAIGRAAQQLSVLSDRAAQAGTTSDELQRLSAAMGVLGVKGADIESLAKAMSYMAKNTGREGLVGLKDTLATIAALPTEGERVTALMRDLGREGAGMAALVRQGPESIKESFDVIMAAMPGLSNAAAETGDSIADGMAIAAQGIKNSWHEMLMNVATGITGTEMSFRELGARIAAYVQYYGKTAFEHLKLYLVEAMNWCNAIKEAVAAIFTDDTIEDVVQRWEDLNANAVRNFEEAVKPYKEQFEAAKEAASHLDDAIQKLTGGKKGGALAEALSGGTVGHTGAGSLVQENSYAALRTTVFSPLRTMTGLLRDIVRNTADTSEAMQELPVTP